MKSLAIVGMMFLSTGLFAQQSTRVNVQTRNNNVIVRTCDRPQNVQRPAVRKRRVQVIQNRRPAPVRRVAAPVRRGGPKANRR